MKVSAEKKKKITPEITPVSVKIPTIVNGFSPKVKIKNVLISQTKPDNNKNPYADLSRKFEVNFEFKPFIHLEGVDSRELRRLKVSPAEFMGVVFTSRSAIDQMFKLCEEMRSRLSPDAKYYCMTETIALYLQKYILYRKRKVFHGDGTFQGMTEIIEKHHAGEKILIPCADIHKTEISDYLRKKGYYFAEAVIFKTVPVPVSLKEMSKYELIVFFSPAGVQSFKMSLPNFKQKNVLFGAFGVASHQAVTDAGYRLDIVAPAPGAPSMAMAIENYLSKFRNGH